MDNKSLIRIDFLSSNYEIRRIEKLGTKISHIIATCSCEYISKQFVSGSELKSFDVWDITLTSENDFKNSEVAFIEVPERQQGFFKVPAHTCLKITLKCSTELLEELFNCGIDGSQNRSLSLFFSLGSILPDKQSMLTDSSDMRCDLVEIIAETVVNNDVNDDFEDAANSRESELISKIQYDVDELLTKIEEMDNLTSRINELEAFIASNDSKLSTASRIIFTRIRILQIAILAALFISVAAIIN